MYIMSYTNLCFVEETILLASYLFWMAHCCVFSKCAELINFEVTLYPKEWQNFSMHAFQMLRLMKGYDEQGTLLLPPRKPSDKLPKEIIEFFEEQKRKLEEEEEAKAKQAAEAAAAAAALAAQQDEGQCIVELTLRQFHSSE